MGRRVKGSGSIYFRESTKTYVGEITVHGQARSHSAKRKADVDACLRAEAEKVAPTQYTVRTAAEAWMAQHVSGLRESTAKNYRQMLDLYVLPHLGDMKPEDVGRSDIRRMVAEMTGKSANTIRLARAVVHALYEWLIDDEVLEVNPCTRVSIPKQNRPKRRALTPAEVNRFLTAMEGTRWYHAVRFILATGLRRGELLALRWTDIRDGWLHVERSVSQAGVELPPKTITGIRRIKLGETAKGILQEQRTQLAKERIASEYIFPGDHGRAVRPNVLTVVASDRAKAYHVHASLHELRHTFATYALAGNAIDVKTLQTMLGHATAAMTLDTYSDMVPTNLEKAAGSVDDFAKSLTKKRSIVVPFTKAAR